MEKKKRRLVALSRKKTIKKIPINDVPEGIRKCRERAAQNFSAARKLVNLGNIPQATTTVVFGFEELGRAKMFNDRLKDAQASGKGFIEVKEKDKIYNHLEKQKAAFSVLPKNLQNLAMGTFDTRYCGSSFFQREKMEILQDLRERSTYVEYKDGRWQDPPLVDPVGLKAFIDGVEEEFDKFMKKSVP